MTLTLSVGVAIFAAITGSGSGKRIVPLSLYTSPLTAVRSRIVQVLCLSKETASISMGPRPRLQSRLRTRGQMYVYR